MGIEKTLGAVAHDFVLAAEKVKATVAKAVADLPALQKDAATAEAVVNGVVEAVYPGSAAALVAIEAIVTKAFQVIQAAGPAVSADGLNVNFDVATVKAAQAVIPTITAAAKS